MRTAVNAAVSRRLNDQITLILAKVFHIRERFHRLFHGSSITIHNNYHAYYQSSY